MKEGQYSPANFNITICVDRRTGGLDGTAPPSQPKLLDTVVETIRHELFHAIQHSYPNVRGADLMVIGNGRSRAPRRRCRIRPER